MEFDNSILGGMNSKVAACKRALAGALGEAGLTDNDLAGFDFLTTKKLHA